MSDFHKDKAHDNHFALLFDSHKDIERKFKAQNGMRCIVIKDKEEKRISSMLQSAGELGASFMELQMAAIIAVALASSYEEAILQRMGLARIVPSGMAVCPDCLDITITTCEENLEVLKDIREAIKVY